MLKVGDRVKPTAKCRKVWPMNNYGAGIGTLEETVFGNLFMVRWDGAPTRCYYKPELLELHIDQLEND